MNAIYWLGLFIILLVIEIISLGLTTIWFSAGALVAFVAAMAGTGAGIQWVLFLTISIVLLVVTRPLAMRFLNKDRAKTNAQSLVGEHATVVEEVFNLQGQGKVIVNGMEWTARTVDDGERIATGEVVTILSISGVKLIVQKLQ